MIRRFFFIILFVTAALQGLIADDNELDEVSKSLNNPVGSTWNLVYQNNTYEFVGDGLASGRRYVGNTFNFQPVLPIPIGPVNLITRPVIPVVMQFNFEGNGAPIGFGDLALAVLVGPSQPKTVIWGLGVTFTFPTAYPTRLGWEKFTVGPSGLLMLTTKSRNFLFGLFPQHFFSYAGWGTENVNYLNMQYFLIWMLADQWQIQMTPNITADFTKPAGEQWTVPIGLGIGKTLRIGDRMWSIQAEYQIMVARPSQVGQAWNIRLVVKQVLPNPFKK